MNSLIAWRVCSVFVCLELIIIADLIPWGRFGLEEMRNGLISALPLLSPVLIVVGLGIGYFGRKLNSPLNKLTVFLTILLAGLPWIYLALFMFFFMLPRI